MNEIKDIATPKRTREIMERHGLTVKKSLGQNFLIEPNILTRMLEVAGVDKTTNVIEIGPGIGALTERLAREAKQVLAFEIDGRLLPVLDETLAPYDNVTVVHSDILDVDLEQVIGEHFDINEPLLVVANLPYYITTPIIMSLLESKLPIERLVVMVQKEVALRMVAKPGTKDYGALSVAVQYYTEPDIVLDVPPKSFLPAPAVTSSVIRCVLRDKPPVDVIDEKLFFRVVKAGFAQRRKTFSNTMKTTGLSKDRIEELLAKANIDGQRRGETFTLQEFADVANAWASLIK